MKSLKHVFEDWLNIEVYDKIWINSELTYWNKYHDSLCHWLNVYLKTGLCYYFKSDYDHKYEMLKFCQEQISLTYRCLEQNKKNIERIREYKMYELKKRRCQK